MRNEYYVNKGVMNTSGFRNTSCGGDGCSETLKTYVTGKALMSIEREDGLCQMCHVSPFEASKHIPYADVHKTLQTGRIANAQIGFAMNRVIFPLQIKSCDYG